MRALKRRERELARHALGLPNSQRRSYRNRFFAAMCPGDYDQWEAMAEAGIAERGPVHRQSRWFWLTEEGARAALEPGESLCPEDFPVQNVER